MTHAEADFKAIFDYARNTLGISDSVGEGRWGELDLEDLFTSIEVHRGFSAPESDHSALLPRHPQGSDRSWMES
jgi:hypothetical protein